MRLNNLKIGFAALAIFFGVNFCSSAQNNNSLLWKISGNGLQKPSYVYGTIHIICPDDFTLRDAAKNAFSETEQVYLELDMDDPTLATQMQAGMAFLDGTSIRDYTTDQEYLLLDNFFKKHARTGMEQLKVVKPMGLMSLSYMYLLKCQPKSYELEFVQMAHAEKKQIYGLETIDQQITIFDQIPYEQQIKLLVDPIADEAAGMAEFKAMIDTYKSEDIEKLLAIMDSSSFNIDAYEDDLLTTRNTDWVTQMAGIMKANSTFFGVGAAHLAGENGILNLLRKEGYTVEPK